MQACGGAKPVLLRDETYYCNIHISFVQCTSCNNIYNGLHFQVTLSIFANANTTVLLNFFFYWVSIERLEKVNIKRRHSQAKLVGTMVAIGGAMLMTFVKGNVIELPWTSKSRSYNGQSHVMNTPKQEDTGKGSIMLVASCFTWSCYIILQVESIPCSQNFL